MSDLSVFWSLTSPEQGRLFCEQQSGFHSGACTALGCFVLPEPSGVVVSAREHGHGARQAHVLPSLAQAFLPTAQHTLPADGLLDWEGVQAPQKLPSLLC